MSMLKFLKEPYPLQRSIPVKIFQAIGLPIAIFSILAFVRPFDLSNAPDEVVYSIAFSYALCTFVPLCFNLIFISSRFEEGTWTLGKEILFILFNFLIIGAVNFIFSYFKGFTNFDLKNIFYSFFTTIAVGFVPVMLYVVVNQYRLMLRYRKEAQEVTERLGHREGKKSSINQISPLASFILEGENPAKKLDVDTETLLFISAADNYVEVYKIESGKITKTLLRSTLKKVADVLASDARFLRVHRGFLVNLSKVVSVSGNAQGFQLHFDITEITIPVSRRLNQFIETLK